MTRYLASPILWCPKAPRIYRAISARLCGHYWTLISWILSFSKKVQAKYSGTPLGRGSSRHQMFPWKKQHIGGSINRNNHFSYRIGIWMSDSPREEKR